MATKEEDKEKKPSSPKPVEKTQPRKDEKGRYLEFEKSYDPDRPYEKPLHEGYRPTDISINPEPPSDSGTAKNE